MIYLNGEYVKREAAKVSIFDRGFLFADGVYEVVPIMKGKAFLFEEHIDRLCRSLEFIDVNNFKLDFKDIFENLIKHEESSFDGLIYIQVTRGLEETRNHSYVGKKLNATVVAFLQPVKYATYESLSVGFSAVTREDYRWDKCQVKSIALLPNVLLKAEADKSDCLEVILHKDNVVTEASASNVFIVKDDVVYTHPANNKILNGITRRFAINNLKDLGIRVEEKTFNVDQLLDAEEVWVASSTKFVAPIVTVDGKAIGSGSPGPIWEKLIHKFDI
ncbi:MAG: hypothetical protein HOO06_14245 [Bdellovibrionaceae bacterium]|jgi:D-alanine transaminase|nr:hypothetical protein [Pseudobdellovibrionaceae bacterium]